MPRPHTLILADGDLTTLVALAMTLRHDDPPRVTLLHPLYGRADDDVRRQHTHRMAAKDKGVRVVDLPPMPLPTVPGDASSTMREPAPLHTPRLLLAALAAAARLAADRVVWPTAMGATPRVAAGMTEVLMLCDHLAHADAEVATTPGSTAATGTAVPQLDAPLLDLTLGQVIELGETLRVDWSLAWSCDTAPSADPPIACRTCTGCRRRAAAFDAAGIADPSLPVARRSSVRA